MANTNIMTGYTYVSVMVFLQVLPRLQCPIAWAKALASPDMAVPLHVTVTRCFLRPAQKCLAWKTILYMH